MVARHRLSVGFGINQGLLVGEANAEGSYEEKTGGGEMKMRKRMRGQVKILVNLAGFGEMGGGKELLTGTAKYSCN